MNAQHLDLDTKKTRLVKILSKMSSLGVAFSGGVDSTLLLAAALIALKDRVVAFTATSPTHPAAETEQAAAIARKLGARHIVFSSNEMRDHAFIANTPERCYHCKKQLFNSMGRHAGKMGIDVLAHGANVDDLSDFRPGFRAAHELGIVAPLIDTGLTKVQIRILARELGLPNWDRPAMACLASRIPYGTLIENHLLRRIERAEMCLQKYGFPVCRVRDHAEVARIEILPQHIKRFLEPALRAKITDDLRKLGYNHICLDLEGYVNGKMNRGVDFSDLRSG
jgi:uncharacterized protein